MNQQALPLVLGMLLATSCTTRAPMVEIRAANIGSAVQEKTASAQFLQARGHLALGSVAIALEGFRRTIRLDPQHVDAMLGMADCYERMGRLDVASVYYEKALAAAPDRRRVYALFAAALDRNGMSAEAQRLRIVSADRDVEGHAARASVQLPAIPQIGETAARLKLRLSTEMAEDAPAPTTAATPILRADRPDRMLRIERLNSHEVALTTLALPLVELSAASSAALRRKQAVAMGRRELAAKARLTILNAARIAGIASQTRRSLRSGGWGEILIGDAPRSLSRTEVRYAADSVEQARRLSGRLGVPMRSARLPNGRVTLWLGRDAGRFGALQKVRS